MELALHFGMPAEELAGRMTEREFRRWALRAQRQWLPARRIEWHLARIAQVVASTFGGAADSTIQDFMLQLEPPETMSGEVDVAEARGFFGFSPRGKKS